MKTFTYLESTTFMHARYGVSHH